MDAAAAEDFCAHFFAVVADLASPVVAVCRADGSAVVASADNFVVFDDDRPHGFFEAGSPFFEDLADAEKVFVVAGSKFPNNIFVVS